MIARPSVASAAPRMKSIWPPTPLYSRWPIESAHDLAGQVDLDRRVDRDHPAERADDVGVVGEVDRPHLDHRVVVDEVVQALRAHHERGHDLAAVALLARPGDHAGLDEVDDRVGEHLGVDAQVAACRAGRAPSAAGIAPIPSWSVAPSGHELGDVLADPPLDVADRADRRARRAGRRTSTARSICDDVDEAVAERPRHRPVELDDDRLRGPDRRVHRLDRRARASRSRARRAASR